MTDELGIAAATAPECAVAQLGIGEVRHARVRPAPNRFAYPTYFLMLPMMFAYFAATTPAGVVWTPDMSNILDFVMVILLGGGVSFKVPVAVMIAVILGWVKPAQLSAWRGYVIVAIFIIAAIITPPDGLTQIMLALPMCALYELGLVLARMLAREKPAAAA